MRKSLLVITAAIVCAVPSVHALEMADFNVKTTRNLVTLCSADENDPMHDAARGYCLGFVDAAINYHRVVTSGDLLAPVACPSETVTRQELVDALLAWAGQNAGLLDGETPIQGVMRAANAKWPCS